MIRNGAYDVENLFPRVEPPHLGGATLEAVVVRGKSVHNVILHVSSDSIATLDAPLPPDDGLSLTPSLYSARREMSSRPKCQVVRVSSVHGRRQGNGRRCYIGQKKKRAMAHTCRRH